MINHWENIKKYTRWLKQYSDHITFYTCEEKCRTMWTNVICVTRLNYLDISHIKKWGQC